MLLLFEFISSFLFFFSFFLLFSFHSINFLAFLITIMILSTFLLFQIEFYFLSLAYLIVYVGAIAVLFLFILMMLPLTQVQSNGVTRLYGFSTYNETPFFSFLRNQIVSSILLLPFYLLIFPNNSDIDIYSFFRANFFIELSNLNDIQSLGFFLILAYSGSIIIISFLLFTVLIGILSIL